jgi:ribosomal protein S18 acetylase RimI-like enzyme
MPRLTQRADIRRLLETDRVWAIYALGDLTPGFFELSEWYAAPGGAPALVLLYRAFATPVLFAHGEPALVRLVLEEMGPQPKVYLSVRPEVLPLVQEHHHVDPAQPMWRMSLEPDDFRPAAGPPPARLSLNDLLAVEALYADGAPVGQSPDFFSGPMLDLGVFYGIWEEGVLVAVAGTHLVSEQESLGAVGNVYTRRDRRGRGLAAAVTSAVTAELLRQGLRTIALNVNQENAAAIHVYERLGYKKYCAFTEGVATQKKSEPTRLAGSSA